MIRKYNQVYNFICYITFDNNKVLKSPSAFNIQGGSRNSVEGSILDPILVLPCPALSIYTEDGTRLFRPIGAFVNFLMLVMMRNYPEKWVGFLGAGALYSRKYIRLCKYSRCLLYSIKVIFSLAMYSYLAKRVDDSFLCLTLAYLPRRQRQITRTF